MNGEWISVKEAAALLGYSPDYFRRSFCSHGGHLVVIREWKGPKGQRRILVFKAEVMAMLQGQIRETA